MEAVDYADIVLGTILPYDLPDYDFKVAAVPSCFVPTHEVVIHDAR